jgi:hypothetical protein
MTAREQAEELRQQAIQTLLDEKKAIDGMLRTLGYEETAPAEKRRGRRPKQQDGKEITQTGWEAGETDNPITSGPGVAKSQSMCEVS